MRALIRGIGDVGSAVAHALHRDGAAVVIHDVPQPAWARRRMAFTDAVFDGECELAGIRAVRVDSRPDVESRLTDGNVVVWVRGLDEIVEAFRPDIVVDARMRKRQVPERQLDLAPLTIGLGPNFVAGETTHLVLETAWGDRLGEVVSVGSAVPLAGGPRLIDGLGMERVAYAPEDGVFTSDYAIGDGVAEGQVIARVGRSAIVARVAGKLRGLTRSGVRVTNGTKVVEIDPRDADAVYSGIGERPARIAEGVLRAVRAGLGGFVRRD